MSRDNYKRAFDDVKADIHKLLRTRERYEASLREIDARLRRLAESARVLGRLSRADPEEIDALSNPTAASQPGITEAVRRAMLILSDDPPKVAVEIRDTIERNNLLDVERYENALAAIYTVLGRMVESGDVDQIPREDGKRAFKVNKQGLEKFRRRIARF
jgi:cell division septum initiation protein DivIVA